MPAKPEYFSGIKIGKNKWKILSWHYTKEAAEKFLKKLRIEEEDGIVGHDDKGRPCTKSQFLKRWKDEKRP